MKDNIKNDLKLTMEWGSVVHYCHPGNYTYRKALDHEYTISNKDHYKKIRRDNLEGKCTEEQTPNLPIYPRFFTN